LENSDESPVETNVADLAVFGDPHSFKLLFKASSKAQGWMKSTKAMEIPGTGCVVQTTTYEKGEVVDALTFVPGVTIVESCDAEGEVTGRKLETYREPHTKSERSYLIKALSSVIRTLEGVELNQRTPVIQSALLIAHNGLK
jgi:hypothetical protein